MPQGPFCQIHAHLKFYKENLTYTVLIKTKSIFLASARKRQEISYICLGKTAQKDITARNFEAFLNK